MSFSNFDNHVRVELPDLGVALGFDYESNELFPGKTPFGDQNVGARVALGGLQFGLLSDKRPLQGRRPPTLIETGTWQRGGER